MIEANCVACGTLNRIAEGDVPAGARFVNCTSCKSRVALPATKAPAVAPPLPKPPGVPAPPKPPAAAMKPPAVPAPPTPPKTPAAKPATVKPLDLADLPAPKRASPLGTDASKPAPKSGLAAALDDDLPAPKGTPGGADAGDLIAPALAGSGDDITDLPAPKPRQSEPPASKSRTTTPPPKGPLGADLPAPTTRGPSNTTPPSGTPATPPRPGGDRPLTDFDLAPAASNAAKLDLDDLPAPKLDRAKNAAAVADLELDLPAPRATQPASTAGFFDDLPRPASGPSPGVEVAPKGFFDDLPQPSKVAAAANPGVEVAPKGFFDDLPQPSKAPAVGPGVEVAPKGFFDDLPQPSKVAAAANPGVEVAPKGFFDDLPQPTRGPAAIALGENLGSASSAPSAATTPAPGNTLDLGAAEDMPALELEPSMPPAKASSFDDLDLNAPSVGPAAKTPAPPPRDDGDGVVRFDKPKAGKPKAEKAPLPSLTSKPGAGAGGDLALELEEPRSQAKAAAKPARAKAPPAEKKVVDPAAAKKKRMILAGAALGAALLGAGGFMFYKRHAAKQAVVDQIDSHVSSAQRALASPDDNRWMRAGAAAQKALELDPKNGTALGIAAESAIAGALADGRNMEGRFQQGRVMINKALGSGVTGVALDRAQALSTLTTAPDKAAPRFEQLVAKAPNDGVLALYLGWAYEAAGDLPNAVKAFDKASAAASVKVLALVGRARVKLLQSDVEGAKADYTAILELDKDHIGAQIGLASTMPLSRSQQQESDLLAVLARKDIGNADARSVGQAWVLAGDVARRGGRLDAARERYRKAIEIRDKDLAALIGLAETDMLDGKLALATETVTKVLAISPDHTTGHLVATELAILQKSYDDAAARLDALSKRPPPATLEQARLKVVTGKLHEAKKEDDAAADAYVEAAKLAGDRDLAPTMLAVAKLSQLANDAAATNAERAASLRTRADQLLSALAASAEKDPALAFTLGMAYAQSGAPEKAEEWLRKVYAARPTDADVMYQLGKTLAVLKKGDEATSVLEKAVAAAPARLELSLELARTYAQFGKDNSAEGVYDKLTAAEDASLEARGHAGRFYARLGKLDKAGVQGEKILAQDPGNAAGHYLKGEAQLAAGKFDLARAEFTAAVKAEREAQYLDGQGRATEMLSRPEGQLPDPALQEAALNAYKAASELDAKLFTSWLGQGRLRIAMRQSKEAIPPLVEANKLKPDDGEVAFLLGAAYGAIGEKGVGRQWLERANKLKPSAEASYRLAKIYEGDEINDPRAAAAAYGRASSLAYEENKRTGKLLPHWYLDALYLYGRFSLDIGNDAAAKRAYTDFLGMKPPEGPRVIDARNQLATRLRSL